MMQPLGDPRRLPGAVDPDDDTVGQAVADETAAELRRSEVLVHLPADEGQPSQPRVDPLVVARRQLELHRIWRRDLLESFAATVGVVSSVSFMLILLAGGATPVRWTSVGLVAFAVVGLTVAALLEQRKQAQQCGPSHNV